MPEGGSVANARFRTLRTSRVYANDIFLEDQPLLVPVKYEFDATVDTATQGTRSMRGPALPAKAIVYGGLVRVLTAAVGVGASIAVQLQSANDLITAAAISGAPWSTTGLKAIIPVESDYTKAIITTAARTPALVITAGDITALKLELWLRYVLSDG